ncbi:hypothetical protein [Pantoea phage Nufs112]|nr:hypothetical protein [Pantoea phage Nufs112]
MYELISWGLCAVGVVLWVWVEVKFKGDSNDD